MKLMLSTAALAAALTTVVVAAPASAQVYTYGSGALLFNLDNLPTNFGGTQANYQPNQDYTVTPLNQILYGNQGVLNQTVDERDADVPLPPTRSMSATPIRG